jgi:hypothetical protein
MRYFKFTVYFATALAICMVIAVSASAAEDVYKQEGANLIEGETREITSSAKTEFMIKGKGVLNVELVTTCKKLKLNASEHPIILGGAPGTSEKEKIEFEECTATVGGSKCSGVEIESAALKNELVTVVSPSKEKGELATLFTPASGEVLSKIKFKSCGLLGSPKAEITGSTAAVTGPEGVFEPEGTWTWSSGEGEITEVEKSNGERKKVELDNEKTKKSTIAGGAAVKADPPWLLRKNVDLGGAGEAAGAGTPECRFTAVKETCKIEFDNNTLLKLDIKNHELRGKEFKKRYKEGVIGCTIGKTLEEKGIAGHSCTDEVEMIFLEHPGVNDYCLTVQDIVSKKEQIMCAGLVM